MLFSTKGIYFFMMLHILNKQQTCQLCISHVVKRKFAVRKMHNFKPLIYHSLNDILNVLRTYEDDNSGGVKELLKIYKIKAEAVKNNVSEERKFPLIVLEGLDGCGKTSVGKRLAKKINAQWWKTPPDSISHLRHQYDEHILLRTAYYSLGNYIASLEVQNITKTTPVVMDRFWHSTAAYAISQSVNDYPNQYKFPPFNDQIYHWPKDLLKPDCVIFLDVSEEVRKQRQSRRTIVTLQENLLNHSEGFRNNVIQAYKNMQEPGVVFVNANFAFGKTLAQIEEKTKHLFQY